MIRIITWIIKKEIIMGYNLKVFTGSSGCFSTSFIDYLLIYKSGLHNKDGSNENDTMEVIAYAMVGNAPISLGVKSINIENGRSHIENIIDIFKTPEPNEKFRSTTVFESNVTWNYKGKQQHYYLRDCDGIDNYNDLWAIRVYNTALSFIKSVYKKNDIWEHF